MSEFLTDFSLCDFIDGNLNPFSFLNSEISKMDESNNIIEEAMKEAEIFDENISENIAKNSSENLTMRAVSTEKGHPTKCEVGCNTCIQVDPHYRARLQKYKVTLLRKSPEMVGSYYQWVQILQNYLENPLSQSEDFYRDNYDNIKRTLGNMARPQHLRKLEFLQL